LYDLLLYVRLSALRGFSLLFHILLTLRLKSTLISGNFTRCRASKAIRNKQIFVVRANEIKILSPHRRKITVKVLGGKEIASLTSCCDFKWNLWKENSFVEWLESESSVEGGNCFVLWG
jgi:hypothetical protein